MVTLRPQAGKIVYTVRVRGRIKTVDCDLVIGIGEGGKQSRLKNFEKLKEWFLNCFNHHLRTFIMKYRKAR